MALIDGYREFTGDAQTDRYDEFVDLLPPVRPDSTARCEVRSTRYQCSGEAGHPGRQHVTFYRTGQRVHSSWLSEG